MDAVNDQFPNKNKTIIICDNYGQAGAINYYSKNKNLKAVSFNGDYINWFKLNTKIENLILVKEFEDIDDLQETSPFFDIGFKADSITNSFAREYKTTIFVFSKPKIDFNQRLKNKIAKKKLRIK